ncbi:MAG TPA: MBL fold metallo-hydrolase, partial [Chitinophagaceae bacterium]|nr:MBL fold metallo-hydrolase [Chitinophagaceae bacterium]
MSLFISSLNSGSNGNCYYIGNGREAVLIDAGISCREIENRLERLQVPVEQVKALFVSHEHADHIKGVERFSSRHQVPVYVTPATRREARLKLDKHRSFSFRAHDPVTVGGLQITAFPKQHDAVDPYRFVVSDGHTRVGVFTDIGTVCDTLVEYFR